MTDLIPCFRNVSYLFTGNKAAKLVDNSSNGPAILQTLKNVFNNHTYMYAPICNVIS